MRLVEHVSAVFWVFRPPVGGSRRSKPFVHGGERFYRERSGAFTNEKGEVMRGVALCFELAEAEKQSSIGSQDCH